jgi:hypothetical protein
VPAHSGLVSLVSAHLRPESTIAIAGEGAAAFGEELARAGGPPLTVEADRFAILSDDLNPPAVGRLRDLPDSYSDLTIVRRAWNAPAEVDRALRVAARVTRPGGEVVATDIDADRLLDGPSPRYPGRLLYATEPKAAQRLKSTTASSTLLAAAAVRASLADVVLYGYDDVRGDYDDAASMWSAIRERGWRGAAWISAERAGAVFSEVAEALGSALPEGSAVDREPWLAVIGRVD